MGILVARCEADIIVNGSFESPTVPVGSFTNFGAGSTAITGWTVVGIDSAVVSSTFSQSGITFNSQHGIQWIDLAGVTSNSMLSGVSQNVITTPGQIYRLSFCVGSTTDNTFFFPATVDLSIDGGTRLSFTNPIAPNTHIDWRQFSHSFSASNPITNITFFNGGAANNFHTGLDSVSLTAVPEPSSAILTGIVGVAAMYFRRRRAGT